MVKKHEHIQAPDNVNTALDVERADLACGQHHVVALVSAEWIAHQSHSVLLYFSQLAVVVVGQERQQAMQQTAVTRLPRGGVWVRF